MLVCRVGADLSLKLVDELKRVYDTYLESIIPPGDVPLRSGKLWAVACMLAIGSRRSMESAFHHCDRGTEAGAIRTFKAALGLSDEDAAPVHIDVGRRIMRSRFEAASRSGSSESFRALQKLIYVSELVFGARKVGWWSDVAWQCALPHITLSMGSSTTTGGVPAPLAPRVQPERLAALHSAARERQGPLPRLHRLPWRQAAGLLPACVEHWVERCPCV